MQIDLPELLPEEKVAICDRFTDALKHFHDTTMKESPRLTIADTFLAGYKAGYGHAKDDVQRAVKEER